jgi:hypothetical protein
MFREETSVRRLALFLAFWLVSAFGQAPMLNLVIVEGDGQINNIRQRTAREPVVQVEDENHKPVAGAVVVFTTPSRGATAAFANGSHTLTATTDAAGRAVGRGLTPNTARGEFQIHVTASYRGQSANADIKQTNAVVTAAGTAATAAGHGKLIAVLAVVGAAAAGGIAYAVSQTGGNNATIPATAIPATISAGGGTVGPPR